MQLNDLIDSRTASRSSLTSEQAIALYSRDEYDVTVNLITNPVLTADVLEYIFLDNLGSSTVEQDIRGGVGQHSNTPIYILEAIVFKEIDENSKIPIDALKAINEYSSITFIAMNTAINEKIAEKLYSLKDIRIRTWLAKNPAVPSHILERMYEKQYSNELASNPSTPIWILEKMSSSSNLNILNTLAKNTSSTIDVFNNLISFGKVESIIQNIAKNPSTPISLLKSIFDDTVLAEITSTYKFQQEIVYSALASNTSCDDELYHLLFKDAGSRTKNALASNPNTPEDILRELSTKEHYSTILNLLTKNPSTPYDVLKRLIVENPGGEIVFSPHVNIELVDMIDFDQIDYSASIAILDLPFIEARHLKKLLMTKSYDARSISEIFCEHPVSRIEDIITAVDSEDDYHRISGYLLDKRNTRYPEFVSYMKETYGVDVSAMPDDMIRDFLNWKQE
jgi:hypothetical protein